MNCSKPCSLFRKYGSNFCLKLYLESVPLITVFLHICLMNTFHNSLEFAQQLDAQDPLRSFRDRFCFRRFTKKQYAISPEIHSDYNRNQPERTLNKKLTIGQNLALKVTSMLSDHGFPTMSYSPKKQQKLLVQNPLKWSSPIRWPRTFTFWWYRFINRRANEQKFCAKRRPFQVINMHLNLRFSSMV